MNKGIPFNTNLRAEIETLIRYRWMWDINYAFQDDEYSQIAGKLPEFVTDEVYKTCLFMPWLKKYQKFF
jgi:hypothetical protein